MKKILFYLLIIFFINFKSLSLEVTLTQGTIKPTPIAVTDFYSNDNKEQKIGKNISIVISDNLERSGLFIPIDKKAFIQNNFPTPVAEGFTPVSRLETSRIVMKRREITFLEDGNGKFHSKFSSFRNPG